MDMVSLVGAHQAMDENHCTRRYMKWALCRYSLNPKCIEKCWRDGTEPCHWFWRQQLKNIMSWWWFPVFAATTTSKSCSNAIRQLLPLVVLICGGRGRNPLLPCLKITGYGNSKPVPPPPSWLDLKRVFTPIEYSSQQNGWNIFITVFSKDSEKRIHWAWFFREGFLFDHVGF